MDKDSQDLITKFMNLRDEDGKPYPDKWIRDIIVNFLIAGRDTTATLLTWTTYLLAKHPDIRKKLLDEIKELDEHTFQKINKLEYLDWVLKESLRLYAPVPGVSRTALNDDVLPDGTRVPAGTGLRYHALHVHRSPRYWDQPLSFIPERWKDQASIIKNSYQYIPFHSGPMSCIGRKMATIEAKCMLILFLRTYDLETVPNHSYELFSGIITNCDGGCPILLKPL